MSVVLVFASGKDTSADAAFKLAEHDLSQRLAGYESPEILSVQHSTTSYLAPGTTVNRETLESSRAVMPQIVVTLLANVRVPSNPRSSK